MTVRIRLTGRLAVLARLARRLASMLGARPRCPYCWDRGHDLSRCHRL
jgi:hypothetical protein